MRDLWQNERNYCAHFRTTRVTWKTINPVFWQEKWLVGATPCAWNFGPNNYNWITITIIIDPCPSCSQMTTNVVSKNTRYCQTAKWQNYAVCTQTTSIFQRLNIMQNSLRLRTGLLKRMNGSLADFNLLVYLRGTMVKLEKYHKLHPKPKTIDELRIAL